MAISDDEAGITLVEIAVSLVILGFVLTTFFLVITNGLQSLSDSRARQSSSQVSTEIVEQLRALPASQIAMYTPATADGNQFDPGSVVCDGVAGQYDPDGPGPLGCEVIRVSDQGEILGVAPFQGAVPGELVTVTTIATVAEGADVPPETTRVTVVLDYTLPDGSEQIRRSALFSEVSRG